MIPHAVLTIFATFAMIVAALSQPLLAQEPDLPNLHDIERFGRPADEQSFTFCVDPRDPAWRLDLEIGKAIADALLLQPEPVILQDVNETGDISAVYRYLLGSCRAYFGFKLIPSGYADWAVLSRPYYAARYVFAAQDPAPQRLGDLPPMAAIATRVGSSADIRLMQYNNSLSADKRWRRFPYSSDDAALQAVGSGVAQVALVWAPSLAAFDAPAPLRQFDPAPLSLPPMQVSALLLARDGYLRNAMDQAIDTLKADGTLARLLDAQGGYALLPE